MRALSIRQPQAEAILRGIKTIKYRSAATRVPGYNGWVTRVDGWGGDGRRQFTCVWGLIG
jgi:hypothetical protein